MTSDYSILSIAGSRVHSHAPSIRPHRGTKVVWPDFQPMRVPEEPVCIRLFRQNPVFSSLHLRSPVHVVPPQISAVLLSFMDSRTVDRILHGILCTTVSAYNVYCTLRGLSTPVISLPINIINSMEIMPILTFYALLGLAGTSKDLFVVGNPIGWNTGKLALLSVCQCWFLHKSPAFVKKSAKVLCVKWPR